MNTRETLTVKRPEDGLCLIPQILGYRPTHHFVYLPLAFCGGVGPALAFDISDGIEPALGSHVASALERFPPDVAIFAAYVPDLDEYRASPEEEILAQVLSDIADVAQASAACGAYYAAFLADKNSFLRLDEPGGRVRSFQCLRATEDAYAHILGTPSPTCEAPRLEIPDVSPQARDKANRTLKARAKKSGGEAEALAIAAFRRLVEAGEHKSASELAHEHPQWCATACAAMSTFAVRDGMLASVLSAQARPGESFMRSTHQMYAEALYTREQPPAVRIRAALRACSAIAALFPKDSTALVIGAYIAWFAGWGSLAAAYLEEAFQRGDDSTMAHLVAQSLAVHLPPPWAPIFDEGPRNVA